MNKLNNELEKYILVQDQRIFIDICKKGCGSGCAYCYVSTKNEKQVLLSLNQIKCICELVLSKYDCRNRVISLCPNTEPLKCAESIKLITFIIKFFLLAGSYIQISTKEFVPIDFLEDINAIASGRVFINVSLPHINNIEYIEPKAASLHQRLQNFCYCEKYKNIKMCLYIKPYTNPGKETQNEYIKIINTYKINNVCVGIKFNEELINPCLILYDNEQATLHFDNQRTDLNSFIETIRNSTNAKVFCSSICCIHNDFGLKCPLGLYKYSQTLCADCCQTKNQR